MTSLLPLPEQQFLDNNGVPLAAGTVGCFIPATMTPKNTWQDAAGTVLNTNPVVLDAAGRAIIYGQGDYRLIVSDHLGNVIYDQLSSSTLAESTISTVMLPVTSAATLATARSLMGIDAYVTSIAAGISLLTGPTGHAGASITGPTGPTGPAGGGGGGGGGFDRQFFGVNGTWTKPAFGNVAVIQIWGAGGGGIGTGFIAGGAGGPGGYTMVMCQLSDLGATVAVTIGAGGASGGTSGYGGTGGNTSFGTHLVQAGGSGGWQASDVRDGAPGYLLSQSGLNIVMGSTDSGSQSGTDQFGNPYASAPFSGSFGQNTAASGVIPSIFGGTGGLYGSGGSAPGGGGGVGGAGGAGQVIVTVF